MIFEDAYLPKVKALMPLELLVFNIQLHTFVFIVVKAFKYLIKAVLVVFKRIQKIISTLGSGLRFQWFHLCFALMGRSQLPHEHFLHDLFTDVC